MLPGPPVSCDSLPSHLHCFLCWTGLAFEFVSFAGLLHALADCLQDWLMLRWMMREG